MSYAKKFQNIVTKNPTLSLLSLMIFFWILFDSSVSYVTPLIISNAGFSNTMMGLIYGASSILGALFDFLICMFFKNTKYRRLFLFMLITSLFYPFILGNPTMLGKNMVFWVLMLAMAVWGLYWDFYGFGMFNFMSFYIKKDEQPSGFGTLQIFRSLGSIIAPIIVGAILVGALFFKVFVIAEIFILISIVFFLILILKIRKQAPLIPIETHRKKKNFFIEVGLWERIGKKLLPCMTVTFFLFIVEAFFWTLAPLYAENSGLGVFGGFFLAAYGLPILIAGLLIGNFVKKYSKTKIAFISLLIGSLILAFFALFSNVYLQIVIVFISALFFGIALPSISGTYSEYIGDVPVVEEEIEALEDFSYNVGYALGPIFAGLLSDIFNIPMAFTILGIVGFVIAVSLLIFTPKKIKIGMSDLNEKS